MWITFALFYLVGGAFTWLAFWHWHETERERQRRPESAISLVAASALVIVLWPVPSFEMLVGFVGRWTKRRSR